MQAQASALYGVLRLKLLTPATDQKFDTSVFALTAEDVGNHLHDYDSGRPKPFDYSNGGHNVSSSKQYVPAHNIVFSGFCTQDSTDDNAAIKTLTHGILSMRNDKSTEQDKLFLDKLWTVWPRLPARTAVCLDYVSVWSQFILAAKGRSLYLMSVKDKSGYHLVWSTEKDLDDRLRALHGERYVYYRHTTLTNGILVLPTLFLASKVDKWLTKLSDLEFVNSLDMYLKRKTRIDTSTDVL